MRLVEVADERVGGGDDGAVGEAEGELAGAEEDVEVGDQGGGEETVVVSWLGADMGGGAVAGRDTPAQACVDGAVRGIS